MDNGAAAILGALLIAGGLLGSPPLALLLYRTQTSTLGNVHWKPYTRFLALIIAAMAMGFSTRSPFINIALIVAVYFCCCRLACNVLSIKRRWLRYGLVLTVSLPMLAGYLLGTIGFLGVGFIAADYTTEPFKTERMSEGLVCRMSYWGSAASDSGYTVALYRQYSLLPFIERKVLSKSVNESSGNGEAESCADLYAKYKK